MFNFSYKTQRYLILFGFLAIPVLLSLTFSYYPALSLLYYSLTDWTGLGWDMNFIGFDNYVEIFTKPEVFSSLKNNLYYLIGGLIQVVFALYFAVILTGKLKGKTASVSPCSCRTCCTAWRRSSCSRTCTTWNTAR